ncbi:MAG: hypothetical protein Q9218_008283 [Villophora microphyllina]
MFITGAKRHIKQFAPDFYRDWIKDIRYGDQDAVAALLFLITPNLEILDVAHPYSGSRWLLCLMNQLVRTAFSSEGHPLPFRKLRTVGFTLGDQDTAPLVDLLHLHLLLPSIREICVHGLDRDDTVEDDVGDLPLNIQSSAVERLQFHDCTFSPRQMNSILGACGQLKTLIYEIGWDDSGYTRVLLSDLMDAIVMSAASLENLWLDYPDGRATWEDERPRSSLISSLSPLNWLWNLKNLKIGLWAFFDGNYVTGLQGLAGTEGSMRLGLASKLPESLETIYVAHTQWGLGRLNLALLELLRSKTKSMPNLKKIVFEVWKVEREKLPALFFAELDDLAAEVNVVVRMIDVEVHVSARGRRLWQGHRIYPSEPEPELTSLGQGIDGSVSWARAYTVKTIDVDKDPYQEQRWISVVDSYMHWTARLPDTTSQIVEQAYIFIMNRLSQLNALPTSQSIL